MTNTIRKILQGRFLRFALVASFLPSIAAADGPEAPAQQGALANTVQQAVPIQIVAPAIEVDAVEIVEAGDSCKERVAAMLNGKTAPAVAAPHGAPTCTWLYKSPTSAPSDLQLLVGAGDVLVAVAANTYDAAIKYQQSGQHKLNVFFNGFNVTEDAELLATELLGNTYFLRYHLKPGARSRSMWAAMIRGSNKLVSVSDLSVSYGWSDSEPNSTARSPVIGVAKLAVTSPERLWLAGGATAALLVFGWLLAYRTSVLRDSLPPNGGTLDERRARMNPYSLSRVQLFSWFMFALSSGLFLKLMYTELPALDGSVLTLLGISTGTGALSWTIGNASSDSSAKDGSLSQGFLNDLVTGPDGDYQVHRVQAVLVNLMLLAIGTYHVVTSIAYPTFDQSWLIFLTISGGTYAFGKQLTEAPRAQAAPVVANPPPAPQNAA
jgi:hypothetical protein